MSDAPKQIMGRPTEYKPEYCDLAIEVLSKGYSILALAAKCDVSEKTIYNWQEKYPEFLQAVKIGQAKSAMWWEELARRNAETGEGNATLTIFGLKNRSKTQWADISKSELTGADGGAIKTEAKSVIDTSQLSTEVLKAIVAAKSDEGESL